MSTINGFGTMHYGWKRLPDGATSATRWVVVCFFPIIPLRHERVIIHSAYAGGGFHIPFVMSSAFQTSIEVVAYLPFDWLGILATYFKGYVVVPAILLLPILAMVKGVEWWLVPFPPYVYAIEALASIVYCALVVAYILDGAAGRRLPAASRAVSSSFTLEAPCVYCTKRVPLQGGAEKPICPECFSRYVEPKQPR